VGVGGPITEAALARGYSSFTGKFRGNAIVAREETPNTSGQSVQYKLSKISTFSELREALHFSAEASVSFFGDGSMAYATSRDINQFSLFILVHVWVVNRATLLTDYSFRPEALALLADPTLHSQFTETYGDEFVSAKSDGGHLYALLRIDASSQESRRKIDAEVEGSYGIYSAEAAFATRFSQIARQTSEKVEFMRQGGRGAIPEGENIESTARKFPERVLSDPWPLLVLTTDYGVVGNRPAGIRLPDFSKATAALRKLGVLHDEGMQLLGDLTYVRRHPGQFEAYDAASIGDKIRRTTALVEEVRQRAASICAEPSGTPGEIAYSFSGIGDLPPWRIGQEVPLRATVTFDGLGQYTYDCDDQWIGSGGGAKITRFRLEFSKPREGLDLSGLLRSMAHAVLKGPDLFWHLNPANRGKKPRENPPGEIFLWSGTFGETHETGRPNDLGQDGQGWWYRTDENGGLAELSFKFTRPDTDYDLCYQARVRQRGGGEPQDTPVMMNGQACGTRLDGSYISAVRIWAKRR
jgi:hypothetical protein